MNHCSRATDNIEIGWGHASRLGPSMHKIAGDSLDSEWVSGCGWVTCRIWDSYRYYSATRFRPFFCCIKEIAEAPGFKVCVALFGGELCIGFAFDSPDLFNRD